MEHIGFGRRFGAWVLDMLFLGVAIVLVIVVYGAVGGARLGLRVQETLGIPVTWRTVTGNYIGPEIEARAEQLARDLERTVSQEFNPEQTEFILRTMGESLERQFTPDRFSIDFFLGLDSTTLGRAIDTAFDAVIEAGRPDIRASSVNVVRAEVRRLLDSVGLTSIVVAAIRFVLWMAFVPLLTALAYALVEGVGGRTLGKIVLGIAVRSVDGEPAYVGRLMLRFALKFSPLLLATLALALRRPELLGAAALSVVLVGIGSLIVIGPDRRALHDYVANTVVVSTRS